MAEHVLACEHVGIKFGGLQAVHDFNLTIDEGELIGLIGPNGAGKTTVFNLITGVYAPTEGSIRLAGQPIQGQKPYQIVRQGIARTFQNIRLFNYLTVMDNLVVAQNKDMHYSILSGMLRLGSYWREEAAAADKVIEILKIFGMEKYANQRAGSLPYGAQRRLEIARAMATNPKLLLLDEPAAGMNPTETDELMDTIMLIRNEFGITTLLIEHDMRLVLGICERLTVLNYGEILAEGNPRTIINDAKVIEAYLGKGE